MKHDVLKFVKYLVLGAFACFLMLQTKKAGEEKYMAYERLPTEIPFFVEGLSRYGADIVWSEMQMKNSVATQTTIETSSHLLNDDNFFDREKFAYFIPRGSVSQDRVSITRLVKHPSLDVYFQNTEVEMLPSFANVMYTSIEYKGYGVFVAKHEFSSLMTGLGLLIFFSAVLFCSYYALVLAASILLTIYDHRKAKQEDTKKPELVV